MPKKNINVPNIGEFKDVEVIEVLVKKGQKIKQNDPLITIESDKSSVEVPSTQEGIISTLYLKVGDKVSEGDKILEIEVNDNLKIKKEFNLIKQENSNKVKSEKKIFNNEKFKNEDF